jgi:hypothetical protein
MAGPRRGKPLQAAHSLPLGLSPRWLPVLARAPGKQAVEPGIGQQAQQRPPAHLPGNDAVAHAPMMARARLGKGLGVIRKGMP